MKKIFLLGTMLGVAGTALAFGGVFSHGSKSTAYKGGVDAIGVHFGGEKKTADSQPKEDKCSGHGTWDNEMAKCDCDWEYSGPDCSCFAPYTFNESTNKCGCPAEKQCGDYCCGGDNVCDQETQQCCNNTYGWCCPNNQTTTMMQGPMLPLCCLGASYCERVLPEKNCNEDHYHCCADGEVWVMGRLSYGTIYSCCPSASRVYKGLGLNGADLCCAEGEEPFCTQVDEKGDCLAYACCPQGSTEWLEGQCCGYGETTMLEDKWGEKHCCEAGMILVEFSVGIEEGAVCCPSGSTGWSTAYEECCGQNTKVTENIYGTTYCCPTEFFNNNNNECCPEGTTGWSDEDGCCEADQKLLDGHCCSSDSTGWSSYDRECCEAGTTVVEDPDGDTHCCPNDSTGFSSYDGECCEEGTTVVEDSDGYTHCCPTEFFDEGSWECCPEGTTGWSDEDGCIQ